MGLFSWLFGKRSHNPSSAADRLTERPSRPGIGIPFGGAATPVPPEDGDNSLWVAVDNGRMTTLMYRDTYESRQRPSNAPDPSQRDLDELLRTVTRVRVFSGGLDRGRVLGDEVLAETTDPTAITALRAALQLARWNSQFDRCACLGGPTLELWAGETVAAVLGLQHGNAVRWNRWRNDGPLADGAALNRWLTDHGIGSWLLDRIYHNQYQPPSTGPGIAPLSPTEQRVRWAELRWQNYDADGAMEEVDAALRAEPGLNVARMLRAQLRLATGDAAGAVADCDAVITAGARDAGLYFTRAKALDLLGDLARGEADCTTAIEIDPTHANAWNSRGIFRMKQGRLEEALADYDEAIRLQPEWELPYLNRAALRVQQGDFDAAIADLTTALKASRRPGQQTDPQTIAKSYWLRAQCYQEKGDHVRAKADFREAAARSPELARQITPS